MEALLPIVIVCLLGIVAARWGHDSRESLMSREEQQAGLGLSWGADLSPATGGTLGVAAPFPG